MPPTLGAELENCTPTTTPLAGSNLATQAISMFNNATDIRIKNSTFNNNIHNTTNVNAGNGLDALYHRVATNAISNTGGRADDAKCHPGTRVEVISLIENWMDAVDGPSRMMWLTGPASAGKTAIVKTIVERCKERGVHTANFFFFRGDPTRNLALPLVATLVYQILRLYPAADDAVLGDLTINPLILEASVEEQFDELIHPLFEFILFLMSAPTNARIVLIVDGLDECDVDANLDQVRIIKALSSLATRQYSPILVLIASRPEPHIRMAFNQVSSRVQSIFLDHQYSPQEDIRLFVAAEFSKIRASHPSAHLLPRDWPSAWVVKDIVEKSSGQFIFAATVMRYIAHAPTVPSLGLERVMGMVPPANNPPFTHLDGIYSFILSRVDDLEAARAILSMNILPGNDFTRVSDIQLLHSYDSRYTRVMRF